MTYRISVAVNRLMTKLLNSNQPVQLHGLVRDVTYVANIINAANNHNAQTDLHLYR